MGKWTADFVFANAIEENLGEQLSSFWQGWEKAWSRYVRTNMLQYLTVSFDSITLFVR
jgi:hypothetical protein